MPKKMRTSKLLSPSFYITEPARQPTAETDVMILKKNFAIKFDEKIGVFLLKLLQLLTTN
jgi:hypothetical protein